jgi:sialate O-acetylesterase
MKNNILSRIRSLMVIFLIPIFSELAIAEEWDEIINLRGYWKFNIGNDMEWAEFDYDDSDWEEILVPSSWEDEGYYNYNGYAWYRKHFDFPKNITNNVVYISLGYIDDVDEVFLNGKLVGSTGSFPPNFGTAYNALRKYPVPKEMFKSGGENIIAVKVYDSRLTGGIHHGDIAILTHRLIDLDINLEGIWKFRTGDDLLWKNMDYDDENWDKISVPSKWEIAGYPDYDGYGWYRKNFIADKRLEGEKLVLLLGKIDDIDQCYLNGELIGSTGNFKVTPKTNVFDNEWQEMRGYYIPAGILRFDGKPNLLSVRVYDGFVDGGIYQGPIGITTQEKYREYWMEKKRKKSFWDYIFD